MGRSKQTARPETIAPTSGQKAKRATVAPASAKPKDPRPGSKVQEVPAGEPRKKAPVLIVVRKDIINNKIPKLARLHGVQTKPETARLVAECAKSVGRALASISANLAGDQTLQLRQVKSAALIYAYAHDVDTSSSGPLDGFFAAADKAVAISKAGSDAGKNAD
jgi:hypothetical protein